MDRFFYVKCVEHISNCSLDLRIDASVGDVEEGLLRTSYLQLLKVIRINRTILS